jgi:SpoVK/Ycf46/Vps4 family AAA+-type ATPase
VAHVRFASAADEGERRAAEDRLHAIDRELAALHLDRGSPFEALADQFGLDALERELLLFLVAWSVYPELSELLRDGRPDRSVPRVDEVADALERRGPERLDVRAALSPGARLEACGCVEIDGPSEAGPASDVGRFSVHAAPHVVDWLWGEGPVPAWARAFLDLSEPRETLADCRLDAGCEERLHLLVQGQRAGSDDNAEAGYVVVTGARGTGKTGIARALAGSLGKRVARVSIPALVAAAEPGAVARTLRASARVAAFHEALLVLDDIDGLLEPLAPERSALRALLQSRPGLTVVTVQDVERVETSLTDGALMVVYLQPPDPTERRALWEQRLADVERRTGQAARPNAATLDVLARKYRFSAHQIGVAVAMGLADLEDGEGDPSVDEALERAARALLPPQLERLSVKVPSDLSFSDLVLPLEARQQLEEFVAACRHRLWVLENWGFGRRLVRGHGIAAMFNGESGTGKTLAAGILAHEIGRPMYRVNLSQLVDKYVGETEKNIERIFQAAQAVQAILLFDEADALFSQRVQVGSSMDRFANLQTNTLLQEIEAYDGISILTTNLDRNIDPAFRRRIQFHVEFPFPAADERAELWRRLLPASVPTDGSLDFRRLGARFEISGGNIRNALLRGAYRAREHDRPLAMADVEEAAAFECRAAGKLVKTSATASTPTTPG